MEIVYQSEFIVMKINHEKKILHFTWLAPNGDMSDEQFQFLMLHILELCQKHGLQKQLADTRLFSFPVTPDLQMWGYQHCILKYEQPTKIACIVPEDLIGMLSVEQVQDEFLTPNYQIANFDTVERAEAWLVS
jgi:hypothetical protein